MSNATLVGNYLDAYGVPVLATQMPPTTSETSIGGYIMAVGWTCRWIKALAPDAEPIYSDGKLRWEHGGRRHAARPHYWIIWDQDRFKVLPLGAFNSGYTPVNFTGQLDGTDG